MQTRTSLVGMLLKLFPVKASERAPVPGRKAVPFAVGEIRMEDEGTAGRGQGFDIHVREATTDKGRGDFGDLISGDEAQAMRRLDDNAVEEANSGTCSTCSTVPNWVPVELRTGVPTSRARYEMG